MTTIDFINSSEQAFKNLIQYIGQPLLNVDNEPYKLEAVIELRGDKVIYRLEGLDCRIRGDVFATLKETTMNYFKARGQNLNESYW